MRDGVYQDFTRGGRLVTFTAVSVFCCRGSHPTKSHQPADAREGGQGGRGGSRPVPLLCSLRLLPTSPAQGFTERRKQRNAECVREGAVSHVPSARELFPGRLTSRSSFSWSFLDRVAGPGSQGLGLLTEAFTISHSGEGGWGRGGAVFPVAVQSPAPHSSPPPPGSVTHPPTHSAEHRSLVCWRPRVSPGL